jgi:hypothetical protein
LFVDGFLALFEEEEEEEREEPGIGPLRGKYLFFSLS